MQNTVEGRKILFKHSSFPRPDFFWSDKRDLVRIRGFREEGADFIEKWVRAICSMHTEGFTFLATRKCKRVAYTNSTLARLLT